MAKALTTKKRIELVRELKNAEIVAFIAAVDAATTTSAVYRTSNTIFDIKGIREMDEVAEGFSVAWTLQDLCHARESEINRAEKAATKAARESKLNTKAAEQEVVQATYKRYKEMPVLKTVLDQVSFVFYKQIYNSEISRYTPMIAKFFTDDKFNLPNPKYIMGDVQNKRLRERYQNVYSVMAQFMAPPTSNGILDPEHRTILHDLATRIATEIVECFRFKLAMKLGAVIDRKGAAEVKVMGYVDHHMIYMGFADGSSFEIKTQQVIAVSCKGNVFARYPTTFHHVTFADGTKMAKPSAGKLQEEFGIDADLD